MYVYIYIYMYMYIYISGKQDTNWIIVDIVGTVSMTIIQYEKMIP